MMRVPAVRRMRTALVFEQAAVLATTADLIGLLVHVGTTLALAGAVLGVMGLGKVAGRCLLLGPVRRRSIVGLAVVCNAVEFVGLTIPLLTINAAVLVLCASIVGAVSGATTVSNTMNE